jgi:putative transcriptional regulator
VGCTAGKEQNPAFKNVDAWCHVLEKPEPGAALLAHPNMGHFQQHHFAQCVILILEHGDRGSLGIILNRPTPFTLSGCEIDRVSALDTSSLSRFGSSFGPSNVSMQR